MDAVFPAYAGMFLLSCVCIRTRSGFPRIRGDVPAATDEHNQVVSVFPAYAGMFPAPERPPMMLLSFPRIRGDVPSAFRASILL